MATGRRPPRRTTASAPADDAPPRPAPQDGERAWKRIIATVKPIARDRPASGVSPAPPDPATELVADPPSSQPRKVRGRVPPPLQPPPPPAPKHPGPIGAAPIDRGWERRISAGRIEPDYVIDLHGHSLAAAHSRLARALDQAVAEGARAILLIAGKVRGPDEAPRGAIRRELTGWLEHGRHASRILAIRGAHPRHGGTGALYILLRKPG